MKRLIGYTAALCLLAIMVGCGGVTSTGTLAYISNSTGTGFTVYTVNVDGTLTTSSISPQSTPAPPRVLQFSANGKWAYFLDAAGDKIYAYTRAGNGTLSTFINSYLVGPGADSLVIAPNSSFLYVALPSQSNGTACPSGAAAGTCTNGAIATFSIDAATGILSQVGSNLQVGAPITQLVMATSGSALFGLSPGAAANQATSGAQEVLSFSVTASTGLAQLANTYPVGVDPIYMVLSANGNFMYVLDHTATTTITNVANVTCAVPNTPPCVGPSPNFYGFTVSGTTLTPMPGTSGGSAAGSNVFNENADKLTGNFPTNPIAGATSNDSRFLFIANQGSHNISAFSISTTTGQPTEVLGALTTVNGIVTSTASPFDCGAGCSTPSFTTVAKANNALYLIDTPAGRIFQFAINQSTGQIRALNPASVGAETATSNPTWITIR